MVDKPERKKKGPKPLKPLNSGASPVVLTFGTTVTNETSESAAVSETQESNLN